MCRPGAPLVICGVDLGLFGASLGDHIHSGFKGVSFLS